MPFKVDKETLATIHMIKPDLASEDLETKVLVKAAQAESKLMTTKDKPRAKSIIHGYSMPKIGTAKSPAAAENHVPIDKVSHSGCSKV